MNCPKCKGKLYVSNSRQIDDVSRFREYKCKGKCGKYLSLEKLDLEPFKEEKKNEL